MEVVSSIAFSPCDNILINLEGICGSYVLTNNHDVPLNGQNIRKLYIRRISGGLAFYLA